MISLEQSPSRPIKLTRESNTSVFIAIAIIGLWAISLVVLLSLDITQFNFLMLLPIIFWQTFLYTGLFITAHDAMHGVVFPRNTKVNHFIGSLCLSLYGLLPYQQLLKKHWLHHHNPATEIDPDFHNGKHKNFFAWYFHFMKAYWSWTQIIALMIIYNVVHYVFHIPKDNLTYFWVIPSIVSSLQLFYFGTFYLIPSQNQVIVNLIALKLFLVQFGGHLSPAIISAIMKNIMNILMFLGGSYQKFIKVSYELDRDVPRKHLYGSQELKI